MTAERVIYLFSRFLGVNPTPGEIRHHAEHTSEGLKHECYLQVDPRLFSEPMGRRKNLLVYSSCHCEQIATYLHAYRQDVLEDCYLHCLYTHRMAMNRETSNNRLVWAMFANADLLIWNVLSEKFGVFSTNVLGKHCKSAVKTVSFVPPCFAAFWPVAEFFGEEGVIEYLVAGRTVEEIVALFRSGRFESNFAWRFKDQVDRLAFRERDRDVKLSEFVRRNYVNHKLFFTVNHPTFPTIAYLTDSCLGHLGFNELGEEHSLSRGVNEAEFGAHLPETRYEFDHYGFKYPLRYPKERGGAEYYPKLIVEAAARWKARGGTNPFNDPNDDY